MGAAERPTEVPSAVVSVDLCEVVRQTGLAMLEIRGGTINDMVSNPETGFLDYGIALNGWDPEAAQGYKLQYAQNLMFHNKVNPTKHHEAIRSFLRSWQQRGIYTLANTSTPEGCELSTIRFLQHYYPGCFNGIMFPRNHDGNGATTKAMSVGHVLEAMQEETGFEVNRVPILAIDDAPHHAIDFQKAGIETYVPMYPWNVNVENQPLISRIDDSLGPLGAFIAVDQRLSALQ